MLFHAVRWQNLQYIKLYKHDAVKLTSEQQGRTFIDRLL